MDDPHFRANLRHRAMRKRSQAHDLIVEAERLEAEAFGSSLSTPGTRAAQLSLTEGPSSWAELSGVTTHTTS